MGGAKWVFIMHRRYKLDKLLRNRQTGSCDNGGKTRWPLRKLAQVENVAAVVR